MIKGISYWSLERGLEGTHPIDDAVKQVAQAGFDAIELCIAPQGVLTPDTPQAQCEAIRAAADASPLTLQTLASGMSWALSPTSNDPQVRSKSIELHAAALQRAAWLGCSAMLFVPGVVTSPIAPDELIRYDLAVDRARDAVNHLLEVAHRVGVDLCLENVWNGLFYSPLEFAHFIDSFQSERLGVYLDVGNLLGYHQYPPHWIELLATRIKRVHVKDFKDNFGWQGTFSFCDLGAGDVPWPQTMAALGAIGYDATIIAEMLPWSPGLLDRTSAALDTILRPASN